MVAKLHHSHAGLLLLREKRHIMIPLTKDVTSVGRKAADIILDDPKVSSTHFEIHRDGARYVLKDLGSTNGTFVNREAATSRVLVDQDVIESGSSTMCYFEDIRDFHGSVDETTASVRNKEEGESPGTGKTLTTTKTLTQLIVHLEVLSGPQMGKKFKFKKTHITVGRNDTDVILVDLDVSRAHCLLEVLGAQAVFLRDMGSTNGTLVRGKPIQSEKVQSGSEFTVGNTTIRVTFEEGEAS